MAYVAVTIFIVSIRCLLASTAELGAEQRSASEPPACFNSLSLSEYSGTRI